jgi:hypothetical protein
MKESIMKYLLQTPNAKKINPKQIAVRCIFCGDSKKNKRITRLYIKINTEDNEPILFHCFNCPVEGILTPQVLREFDIRDLELSSELLTYNNAISKYTKGIIKKDNEINIKIPVYNNIDARLEKKKNYIEDRLGIKLSFDELYKLKTIFNLYDFIEINKIEEFTMAMNYCDNIDENYIGFLSTRNEFINFRNIISDDHRYIKYSIFKNLDNTRRFYTIPNKIDILTNNKITINIAEGVFDILGVYYNITERETHNMIYAAVCGAGYISVIKYFIEKGIFGNVDLHIYSDSDMDIDFYRNALDKKRIWIDNIKVFYNEKRKDFGVPKDNIKIIKKRL